LVGALGFTPGPFRKANLCAHFHCVDVKYYSMLAAILYAFGAGILKLLHQAVS
jgi:hypothetical protein